MKECINLPFFFFFPLSLRSPRTKAAPQPGQGTDSPEQRGARPPPAGGRLGADRSRSPRSCQPCPVPGQALSQNPSPDGEP